MIRISDLRLTQDRQEAQQLTAAAAKRLHCPGRAILGLTIIRKSLDARKVPVHWTYTVDVSVSGERGILRSCRKDPRIGPAPASTIYAFPACGSTPSVYPPVIVGMGPAGLFAGLMLARAGYRPVILERGQDVDARKAAVEAFWKDPSRLDPESSPGFGEGGAGTFSDGKLTTMVKDPFGRGRKVLELFVEAGAPPSILYDARPHLGTDVLMHVVKQIREEIIRLGGQVRFGARVTDLVIRDGAIAGVEVNHNYIMSTNAVILASGHSARDTFEMLDRLQVPMEPKAFAMGVRIEHPQKMISDICHKGRTDLPPADYKLTYTTGKGRGVYTFCMCPGGYVVNAATEPQTCVTNGMSYSGRGSENANSAVIVTVTPGDFISDDFDQWDRPCPKSHALIGMYYQRMLEKRCYTHSADLGHPGAVPVQLFADFCLDRRSEACGDVRPVHKGPVVFGNIRRILPEALCESLEEGIHAFSGHIPGFDRPDALLSAVESRTSSPVRILRDGSTLQSTVSGLYPCGEGAGYAGGITSAAMDGIRAAEAYAARFCPPGSEPEKTDTQTAPDIIRKEISDD